MQERKENKLGSQSSALTAARVFPYSSGSGSGSDSGSFCSKFHNIHPATKLGMDAEALPVQIEDFAPLDPQ